MNVLIGIVTVAIIVYFIYKVLNFYLDPHRRPTKRELQEERDFELEKLNFTLEYQEKLKQKRLQQTTEELLQAMRERDGNAGR